jgi:DNA invertase Pin-like site-specific DNA recombinase
MSTNRLRGESHPRAKLKDEQVLEIRKLYDAGFSHNLIARNFKISTWNVVEIGERKTWKHLP